MSTQDEFFHENWRESLKHLVKALGGYEAAGAEIFPNKTRKAAGNWLSDCLNEERSAKLDLEEIQGLLRLGRAIGCHIGIHLLCDETDYMRPTTVEPEDTLAEVERLMDKHVSKMGALIQQYERAVKSATVTSLRSCTPGS